MTGLAIPAPGQPAPGQPAPGQPAPGISGAVVPTSRIDGTPPPGTPPPGPRPAATTPWGKLLCAVDDAVEGAMGRCRGNPMLDAAALVTSNLADYGFVWAILAAVKARRPGAGRRRALWALALSGVASASVNTAVKQAVRRQRPAAAVEPPGPGRLPIRRPRSSSFPSGHTLAAFCTACVLPERRRGVATALGFATAVAASRVQVRAHHASDVLGGALIGGALGAVVRSIVRSLVPGEGD